MASTRSKFLEHIGETALFIVGVGSIAFVALVFPALFLFAIVWISTRGLRSLFSLELWRWFVPSAALLVIGAMFGAALIRLLLRARTEGKAVLADTSWPLAIVKAFAAWILCSVSLFYMLSNGAPTFARIAAPEAAERTNARYGTDLREFGLDIDIVEQIRKHADEVVEFSLTKQKRLELPESLTLEVEQSTKWETMDTGNGRPIRMPVDYESLVVCQGPRKHSPDRTGTLLFTSDPWERWAIQIKECKAAADVEVACAELADTLKLARATLVERSARLDLSDAAVVMASTLLGSELGKPIAISGVAAWTLRAWQWTTNTVFLSFLIELLVMWWFRGKSREEQSAVVQSKAGPPR